MIEPTMKTDTNRATGRTLGLALQALGKAVQNPGTEVEFINHNPQKHAQNQMCKEQIELLAKTLNLDVSVEVRSNKLDDRFRPEPFSIFVKSNWVSPYSQRTPAEEKWKELYGFYPDIRYDVEMWEYFQQGFDAARK